MIVIDAGVLIALLDSKNSHHEWALNFFIQTTDSALAISALTLAEVSVYPARDGKQKLFEESISGLDLEVISVSPDAVSELASLRATTGLKMPDVVVLQLSQSLKARLATTDRALAELAKEQGVLVFEPPSR